MGRDSVERKRSGQVKGRAEALARRLHKAGQAASGLVAFSECAGVLAAIDAVVDYGAAITFSRVTNGSALSVTVIDNGSYERNYPHDEETVAALMQAICEVYGETPGGT